MVIFLLLFLTSQINCMSFGASSQLEQEKAELHKHKTELSHAEATLKMVSDLGLHFQKTSNAFQSITEHKPWSNTVEIMKKMQAYCEEHNKLTQFLDSVGKSQHTFINAKKLLQYQGLPDPIGRISAIRDCLLRLLRSALRDDAINNGDQNQCLSNLGMSLELGLLYVDERFKASMRTNPEYVRMFFIARGVFVDEQNTPLKHISLLTQPQCWAHRRDNNTLLKIALNKTSNEDGSFDLSVFAFLEPQVNLQLDISETCLTMAVPQGNIWEGLLFRYDVSPSAVSVGQTLFSLKKCNGPMLKYAQQLPQYDPNTHTDYAQYIGHLWNFQSQKGNYVRERSRELDQHQRTFERCRKY